MINKRSEELIEREQIRKKYKKDSLNNKKIEDIENSKLSKKYGTDISKLNGRKEKTLESTPTLEESKELIEKLQNFNQDEEVIVHDNRWDENLDIITERHRLQKQYEKRTKCSKNNSKLSPLSRNKELGIRAKK